MPLAPTRAGSGASRAASWLLHVGEEVPRWLVFFVDDCADALT
jgi:hypothetical protein